MTPALQRLIDATDEFRMNLKSVLPEHPCNIRMGGTPSFEIMPMDNFEFVRCQELLGDNFDGIPIHYMW